MVKGKQMYKVRIDNASPLLLNGLAIAGVLGTETNARVVSGISIPPARSLTVSASGDTVEKLGLKKGIKVSAADLSGL